MKKVLLVLLVSSWLTSLVVAEEEAEEAFPMPVEIYVAEKRM
jgi:hypothetical protein